MDDHARLFGVWNWLPAFTVVARTPHLPTASRRLHVSVSALSRTIKQLEAALEYPLFERAGRGLVLTDRGRALHEVVERLVDDTASALARAVGDPPAIIPVAIAHTVSQRAVVPALLAALAGPAGPVPSLLGGTEEEARALVLSGDVALALVSGAEPHPGLRLEKIGELARGVFCGAGHPLFAVGIARVKGLASHPFVALRDTPGGQRVAVFVNQEETALELCLAGRFLAELPELVAEPLVARGQLRRVAAGRPPLVLHAARRRAAAGDARLDAVVTRLRERLTGNTGEPAPGRDRFGLGDELLVRAEHDAAVRTWAAAAAAAPLSAAERAAWELRLARVAVLRGDWGAITRQRAATRRDWAPAALAQLDGLFALAACYQGDLAAATQRALAARSRLERLTPERLSAEETRRAWLILHRAEGTIHVTAGRPAAAIRAHEAAETLCAALGDGWERSISFYNLGEAHLHRGDLDAAEAFFDRAAEAKAKAGYRWGRVWVHHGRAMVELLRGKPDLALREAAEGLNLALDVAHGKPVAMLQLVIGRAQLAIGHSAEAVRSFRFAARSAGRAKARAEQVQAQLGLVDAKLRAGQLPQATAELDRARRLAPAARSACADAAVLVATAALEERRGRHARAQKLLTDAAAHVPDPLRPYGYWFQPAIGR